MADAAPSWSRSSRCRCPARAEQGPARQRVHADAPGQAAAPPPEVKPAVAPRCSRAAAKRAAPPAEEGRRHEPRRPSPPQLSATSATGRCCRRRWRSALIFIAILAVGALLDWKDQYDALDRAQQEEGKLREQYATKKAKAINFELYVQQLHEIEQSFGALLEAAAEQGRDGRAAHRHQPGGARPRPAVRAVPAARRSERQPTSTPSCRSASGSPATITTWARSRATSRNCRGSSR